MARIPRTMRADEGLPHKPKLDPDRTYLDSNPDSTGYRRAGLGLT